MITTSFVIDKVCEALEVDREGLLTDKVYRNLAHKRKYQDARLIAVVLIRQKVNSTTRNRASLRDDNCFAPIFQEIAELFNRKVHSTVLNWELEGKVKLKACKEFKEKYDNVFSLLK